jgi:gliding motility-associated-like protein
VEQGVYIFDLNLPVSTQSYHIIYQRCCRNNTLTNITEPGATGATYWIEITPKAQQYCNNSPTFKQFPPIVICAGEPVDFDHSATDPEGDSLVYELFSPFNGGGNDEVNITGPGGVAPDPDLPPPFQAVNFLNPFYTFNNPLGGTQSLAINPSTGFLTGVPDITGQFVVGVLVKEYRNNELLSIIRRDFQFNVAVCDPTVVADIKEDELITQQSEQFYVINACGLDAVPIVNQSFQQTYISEYRWEFLINGNTQTYTAWSPSVTFPGTGTYYGKLLLNPGTNCGDTANILVNIYPAINADFSYEYDTCIAGPVTFTDLSSSDAGPGTLSTWSWNLGDGNTSEVQDPVHTYSDPGNIPVSLEVTDTNGCKTTKTRVLSYFPVPRFFLLGPASFTGCEPAEIFFDNLSNPVDETYDILWDFGDGGTGTDISPSYVYEDAGTFTVSLSITSPIGCKTDTVWNDLITVQPSPVAGFSYSPQALSNLSPTASFFDESQFAYKWKWTFGNSGISIDPNPVHTFPDTGLQLVQQVVFHPSGCTDTATALLDVVPEVRYFLPNAFTPDGDGLNDGFLGAGSLEGATSFRLAIWNRYGEKLFETDNPKEAWNGRKNNSGELSPQDVYIAVVTFKGPRGEPVEIRGYATLVK